MARPDVSEERKEQILTAATAVFADRGFAHARMDDIAWEANLSKGTLYWYFKSKDDIIVAILHHLCDQEYAQLQTLLTAEGTVRQRLRQFAHHSSAELEQMANLLPMFFEFYALAGRDTAVRDFLKRHFQRSRNTLIELIEQGIERGEFHNIDAEQATLMLVAVHEGLELMWLIEPQAVNLTALKEQAIHQLLASLE